MDENKTFSNEMLQYLLSIPDPLPEGKQGDVRVQLREAPSASLFVLSRQAQSSEVRSEAARALDARLREGDDSGPGAALHSDAVARGELPPELATARHFYKFPEDEQWVLSTRSGVRIATFSSEADLDRWWRGLKKQRGRMLTRVRKATS
jgi:hypothetical protein